MPLVETVSTRSPGTCLATIEDAGNPHLDMFPYQTPLAQDHTDAGGKLSPIIVDAETPPLSVSSAQHQTVAPFKDLSSTKIPASRQDDASSFSLTTPKEARRASSQEDSTSSKNSASRQEDAPTPSLNMPKQARKASS